MVQQSTYEVLVKLHDRWEIHSRHAHGEKMQAIEEAKVLDAQKHVQSVKVIQEVFNPDDGTFKEYKIYSPGAKKYHPPHKKTTKRPQNKAQAKKTRAKKRRRKKKNTRSITGILVTIALISAFSIVFGAIATWLSGMYMADFKITGNAKINILFMIFLGAAAIVAIPLAMIFLGKEDE